MEKSYDIIVVGSGAGLNSARSAVSKGFKAAFVEKSSLGGTFLNRGCIPSKMLMYPAETADRLRSSAKLAISAGSKIEVDFNKVINRINKYTAAVSDNILKSVTEMKA